MTVIQMLEKRIELHTADLYSRPQERAVLEARIAECRNLIYILTANKQITGIE